MNKLEKLYRLIDSRMRPGRWHLISDKGNWVFTAISENIARQVRARYQTKPVLLYGSDGLHLLQNQIIHFINRYTGLSGIIDHLHPSNKIYMNWFHGSRSDPNPHIHRLFEQILNAEERIEKIVVSCEIAKANLIEEGIKEAKIVKIPLGVDTDLFGRPADEEKAALRDKLGIPADSFCIGSFQKDGVGWEDGLEPKLIKGPDILLAVIRELSRKYDDIFVVLTGPARGYVKKGLKSAGVRFVHSYFDEHQKISEMFKCLDLYLVTSRDEGGPMSLLESWATGVPVISTKVGMPADLIDHGVNGFLAEIGDVSALAKYIIEFKETPGVKARFSADALQKAQRYSWWNIAGMYVEMLSAETAG